MRKRKEISTKMKNEKWLQNRWIIVIRVYRMLQCSPAKTTSIYANKWNCASDYLFCHGAFGSGTCWHKNLLFMQLFSLSDLLFFIFIYQMSLFTFLPYLLLHTPCSLKSVFLWNYCKRIYTIYLQIKIIL